MNYWTLIDRQNGRRELKNVYDDPTYAEARKPFGAPRFVNEWFWWTEFYRLVVDWPAGKREICSDGLVLDRGTAIRRVGDGYWHLAPVMHLF